MAQSSFQLFINCMQSISVFPITLCLSKTISAMENWKTKSCLVRDCLTMSLNSLKREGSRNPTRIAYSPSKNTSRHNLLSLNFWETWIIIWISVLNTWSNQIAVRNKIRIILKWRKRSNKNLQFPRSNRSNKQELRALPLPRKSNGLIFLQLQRNSKNRNACLMQRQKRSWMGCRKWSNNG